MLPVKVVAQKQCALAQVMRHDVSVALGKTGPNVDVMCTDKQFGGRFMPFAQVGMQAACWKATGASPAVLQKRTSA